MGKKHIVCYFIYIFLILKSASIFPRGSYIYDLLIWSAEAFAENHCLFVRYTYGHSKHSTHGHHQMVNTEIRLIIIFAAKSGELYTVSKNNWELTVAQIMNSLLPNSDLN